MVKKIEIRIQSNGQISLEPKGAKGKECLSWTEGLEKDLQAKSPQREFKPEFFQDEERSYDQSR